MDTHARPNYYLCTPNEIFNDVVRTRCLKNFVVKVLDLFFILRQIYVLSTLQPSLTIPT